MARRFYIFLLISLIFFGYHSDLNAKALSFYNNQIEFDLDSDGQLETATLEEGKVKITKGDEIIFESDKEWLVEEILVGDFDNNEQIDFAMSLWKQGNYGDSKPFWVEENDQSYKMHLFLYTWKRGNLRPLWHSSNLPKHNLKTWLLDLNQDGKNELLVLEKDYQSHHYSLGIWSWSGWGFQLERRLTLFPYFGVKT